MEKAAPSFLDEGLLNIPQWDHLGEDLKKQDALTLRLKFNITKAQAQDIVVSCRNCVMLLPAPSLGVNPKGLLPNHIWHMDVTRFRIWKVKIPALE